MAKHVLVTGFEPSAGDKNHPSETLARSLEGRSIAGRTVVVHVVPYETSTLRDRLEKIVAGAGADLIVGLAQFGGRPSIAMERVAVNMTEGDVIAPGGPDARLSSLPFERIAEAWREHGIPGYVSNSAGGALGNQALYELLALAESAVPPAIAGLLHVPYLPAQAIAAGAETTPSMSLELMGRAVETLIETTVSWIEQRAPETAKTPQRAKPAMWIPRAVKEVER